MTKPNAARVYDYLLGGTDNLAADRVVGEMMLRLIPDARHCPRANREFLHRVVRYLAMEAGVRQFIDVGSGLPTQGNVHEVVQAVDPSIRVAYVDYDHMVLSHAQSLLADDNVAVVWGDLRDPETIVQDPVVRRVIDFEQPVGLLLFSLLHHIDDKDSPYKMVGVLRDAVPVGSYLAISHPHDPGQTSPEDSELALLCQQLFSDSYGSGLWRRADDIQRFFGDWEMLSPGLVPATEWRPVAAQRLRYLTHYLLLGGVARRRNRPRDMAQLV
jgi:S-adenosyl methyltransferase